MNTSLTLLRHGESEGNAGGLIQGQSDFPLTETGRSQAGALARYWRQQGIVFDRIFASPLERALQTAGIISDTLGAPVEARPVWLERHFGEWEARPFEELRTQVPPFESFHTYHRFGETGESAMDLYLRAGQAVQELMQFFPGRFLVVSHGAFLNMVLYHVLGLAPASYPAGPRFEFGNTSFIELAFNTDHGRWTILDLIHPRHWNGEKQK